MIYTTIISFSKKLAIFQHLTKVDVPEIHVSFSFSILLSVNYDHEGRFCGVTDKLSAKVNVSLSVKLEVSH